MTSQQPASGLGHLTLHWVSVSYLKRVQFKLIEGARIAWSCTCA